MPPNGDEALYDQVKGTSTKRLVNAVEKVDGLSPEQEEALERGGIFALRGTKRRLQRWCLYGLFWVSLIAVTVLMLALVGLIGIYVFNVYNNGTISEVIENILGFFFGVTATLAVEFLRHLLVKKPD